MINPSQKRSSQLKNKKQTQTHNRLVCVSCRWLIRLCYPLLFFFECVRVCFYPSRHVTDRSRRLVFTVYLAALPDLCGHK